MKYKYKFLRTVFLENTSSGCFLNEHIPKNYVNKKNTIAFIKLNYSF